MTPATLRKAVAEAERFIAAAKAVPSIETHLRPDGNIYKMAERPVGKDETFEPSRYSAAATRASLDLTRALADLRRR